MVHMEGGWSDDELPARVDELVQQGLLQWATQGEVCDAYLAWSS